MDSVSNREIETLRNNQKGSCRSKTMNEENLWAQIGKTKLRKESMNLKIYRQVFSSVA